MLSLCSAASWHHHKCFEYVLSQFSDSQEHEKHVSPNHGDCIVSFLLSLKHTKHTNIYKYQIYVRLMIFRNLRGWGLKITLRMKLRVEVEEENREPGGIGLHRRVRKVFAGEAVLHIRG